MAVEFTIEFDEPEIQVAADGTLGFEWQYNGQTSIRVMAGDIRMDGDYIYADITVWYLYDQPMGVRPVQPKSQLKMNSSHHTGWRNIHTALRDRFPDVDWIGAMTIVADEVITRYEAGNPTIDLSIEVAESEAPFILEPWISSSGSTVMYGEGGISKSLLALAFALSVSTGVPIFGKEPRIVGPVMYFDYEDDHKTHVQRLVALCKSFGIPQSEARIHYHALSARVTAAKTEMHKRAVEVGAVLGILDSVGMGRGGSAIAAEDTIRMFRALREIGIPFLTIDHVSKASKEQKGGDVDAYGSIYTMTSARLAWSLVPQVGNDDRIHIHATNRKANHVRLSPPQSIAIKYRNDERGVPEYIDIEVGNEFGMLMPSVGTHQKIMMWIIGTGNDWHTYAQLQEDLGIPSTTLRSTVSRDNGKTFETSKDGKETLVRCVANTLQHTATDDATDEDSE